MGWSSAQNFTLVIGNVGLRNCCPAVSCNGIPLITVKRREPDGRFGVDLDLYDENGNRAGTVSNGKVKAVADRKQISKSHPAYTVAVDGRLYQLVERKTGVIVFQMERNPNGAELAVAMNLYLPGGRGLALRGTPYDIVTAGNSTFSGFTFDGLGGPGFVIGGSGPGFPIPMPKPADATAEQLEEERRDFDRLIRQYNDLRKRNPNQIFDPVFSAMTLCNSTTTENSIITLHGPFSEIVSGQFPFVRPQITAFAEVLGIEGSVILEMQLVSPVDQTPLKADGKQGRALSGVVSRGAAPDEKYQIVSEWKNVVFEEPGEYALQILRGTDVLAQQSLVVRKAE